MPGLNIPPRRGGQAEPGRRVGRQHLHHPRRLFERRRVRTTGVYMDDTSLTRRNNAGVFQEERRAAAGAV